MRDTEQKVQEAREALGLRAEYWMPEVFNRAEIESEVDALISAVRADERQVCALAVERALPAANNTGHRIVRAIRDVVQGLRNAS